MLHGEPLAGPKHQTDALQPQVGRSSVNKGHGRRRTFLKLPEEQHSVALPCHAMSLVWGDRGVGAELPWQLAQEDSCSPSCPRGQR